MIFVIFFIIEIEHRLQTVCLQRQSKKHRKILSLSFQVFYVLCFCQNAFQNRNHMTQVFCLYNKIPDGFKFFPAACIEEMF